MKIYTSQAKNFLWSTEYALSIEQCGKDRLKVLQRRRGAPANNFTIPSLLHPFLSIPSLLHPFYPHPFTSPFFHFHFLPFSILSVYHPFTSPSFLFPNFLFPISSLLHPLLSLPIPSILHLTFHQPSTSPYFQSPFLYFSILFIPIPSLLHPV